MLALLSGAGPPDQPEIDRAKKKHPKNIEIKEGLHKTPPKKKKTLFKLLVAEHLQLVRRRFKTRWCDRSEVCGATPQ